MSKTVPTPMNAITTQQNTDDMLRLLRARRLLYRRAKRMQALSIGLTLALPILGALAATIWPVASPWIAAFAILFTVVDASLLDTLHKARLKTAAKLQEAFDCDLLSMDWNEFLVGPRVDAEEVYAGSSQRLSEADEAQIRDWYPKAVALLPMHLARLICQRENLMYDSALRRSYCTVIAWLVGVLVLLAIVVGLAVTTSLPALVLAAAPAAPALSWMLRETRRQRDTIEQQTHLKTKSQQQIERGLEGASEQECRLRSRELQDAIYAHRVSSPLILDIVYQRKRETLERAMEHGAQKWANDYQRMTGGRGIA